MLHRLLLVITAVSLLGQAPKEVPKNARIEGVVLNAKTNQPLNKAEITIFGPGGNFGARSDAEGKFTMEDLPPGHYFIRCERLGFLSSLIRRVRTSGTALELTAGQEIKDFVFRLTPQAVIAGRVVDSDGDPSPNALVSATRKGGEYWEGQTATNDLGEFRMAGLPPGKWILGASPGMLNLYLRTPSVVAGSALVKTYYQNATDASQAVPLELVPGQETTGIELRLTRAKAVRISGKVLGPTGVPAEEATVVLHPRSNRAGGAAQRSSTGKEGEFTFKNVAPGSYQLLASADGIGNRPSVQQTVDVGNESVGNLTLRLVPPVDIAGRIVAENDGKPQWKDVSVQFRSTAEDGWSESLVVNNDGSFSLTLKPDNYRVSIVGLAEDYWLKSSHEVEITAASQEMRLVIAPQAPKVSGIAKTDDGKPVPGATVAAIQKDSTEPVSAVADRNGHYEMSLPPGEYRIYAWDGMERGGLTDPDFLKQSQEKSVAVKLALGEKITLDVLAQPFGQ